MIKTVPFLSTRYYFLYFNHAHAFMAKWVRFVFFGFFCSIHLYGVRSQFRPESKSGPDTTLKVPCVCSSSFSLSLFIITTILPFRNPPQTSLGRCVPYINMTFFVVLLLCSCVYGEMGSFRFFWLFLHSVRSQLPSAIRTCHNSKY